MSKANGYVKLYLKDLKAIDFICATGFDFNGERIFPEPLVKPATKIVLSNVEPFIPDSVLLRELSRFGKPIVDSMKTISASIKHESLRHVLSHRRQVFVVLKPEYSDIDGMINIKYNEHNYRVYVSSSVMRCFRCGAVSHLIAGCPEPELPRIGSDKDFPALGNNEKQKTDSEPKGNDKTETEKSDSRPEKRGLPADSSPENGEPSTSSNKKPREEQITIDDEPRTEQTTENERSEQQNGPRAESMVNGQNEQRAEQMNGENERSEQQNETSAEQMTNGKNEQNVQRDEPMTNGENKQTTNDNEELSYQTNEQSKQDKQTNDKDEQTNAIQTVDRATDEDMITEAQNTENENNRVRDPPLLVPQHSDERVLPPPSSNTLSPNNAVNNLFRLDDLPSVERMTDWSPGLASEDDTNMETLSQVSEACDLEELSEPTEEQDNETRYRINLGVKKRQIELIPEKEIEEFLENIKTRKNHLKLCVEFCSNYKKLYFSLQKYRLQSAVSDKNLNQRIVRLCEKIKKVCKVKKIDLEK